MGIQGLLRSMVPLALLGPAMVGCGADELYDTGADGVEVIAQKLATAEDIAHACEHVQAPPAGAYAPISATSSALTTSPFVTEHDPVAR